MSSRSTDRDQKAVEKRPDQAEPVHAPLVQLKAELAGMSYDEQIRAVQPPLPVQFSGSAPQETGHAVQTKLVQRKFDPSETVPTPGYYFIEADTDRGSGTFEVMVSFDDGTQLLGELIKDGGGSEFNVPKANITDLRPSSRGSASAGGQTRPGQPSQDPDLVPQPGTPEWFERQRRPRISAERGRGGTPKPRRRPNALETVVDAAATVPGDLVRGVGHGLDYLNPLDDETVGEKAAEDVRWVGFIGSLVANPLDKLGMIVDALMEVYFGERIPADLRPRIRRAVTDAGITMGAYITGRVLGSTAVKAIARKLLTTAAVSQALKRCGVAAASASTGVGIAVTVAMVAGLAEKMQAGSKSLKGSHPAVYQKLRPQDLDLLWVFIEPELPRMQQIVNRNVRQHLDKLALVP